MNPALTPGLPALLRRDTARAPLMRSALILRDSINAEKRQVTVALTSETPVDRWGDKEILLHGAGNVRLDRLRTVGAFHLYHDVTQPVASIVDVKLENKQTLVTVQFGTTQLANDAWANVRDGILRGVSAGYAVYAWEYNEQTHEARATDWEIFEGSFTTIPADPTVGLRTAQPGTSPESVWRTLVRSALPTHHRATAPKESPMRFRAWLAARGLDYSTLTAAQKRALLTDYRNAVTAGTVQAVDGDTDTTDSAIGAEPVTDPAQRSTPLVPTLQTVSNFSRESAKVIIRAAAEFGVAADDYLDETKFPTSERAIAAMMDARAANLAKSNPQAGSVRQIQVGTEDLQKRTEAVVDGMTFQAGCSDKDAKDGGMRRMRPTDMVRQFLMSIDPQFAGRATQDEIMRFASRTELSTLSLRDANQISGTFTNILANVLNKVLFNAYGAQNTTHQVWTTDRYVPDFKAVTGVSIIGDRLTEQDVPGGAFREASFKESAYNAKLGLWGKTVKVTWQDWRNDDLGAIFDLIRNYGTNARLTEDFAVYSLLLAQNWTGRTTTTAAFYDATNERALYNGLGKTLADLENREITVGGDTVPAQFRPQFLLVPSAHRRHAQVATGMVQGQQQLNPIAGEGLTIVGSPWLSSSSLSGSNADDYFVVAGKETDSIKILRDQQAPNPIVRQVDTGYSPDVGFLVLHAFKAFVANLDPIQKGDWA